MKRLFLALALAVSLATVAYAKEFTFNGCTTDEKAVALVVDLVDITDHPVAEHVAVAFSEAAKLLSAEELQSEIGFYAFVGGLDETDLAAINGISGPPQVVGECKQ